MTANITVVLSHHRKIQVATSVFVSFICAFPRSRRWAGPSGEHEILLLLFWGKPETSIITGEWSMDRQALSTGTAWAGPCLTRRHHRGYARVFTGVSMGVSTPPAVGPWFRRNFISRRPNFR